MYHVAVVDIERVFETEYGDDYVTDVFAEISIHRSVVTGCPEAFYELLHRAYLDLVRILAQVEPSTEDDPAPLVCSGDGYDPKAPSVETSLSFPMPATRYPGMSIAMANSITTAAAAHRYEVVSGKILPLFDVCERVRQDFERYWEGIEG